MTEENMNLEVKNLVRKKQISKKSFYQINKSKMN